MRGTGPGHRCGRLALPVPAGGHPGRAQASEAPPRPQLQAGQGGELGGLLIHHLIISTALYVLQALCPLQKPEDKPLFADGYPYLLVTQPSLAALNTELAGRGAELVVEDRRFRPNITVEGEFPAWAEDTWAWVRVGEATFRNVKPCTRCDLLF